MAKHKSKDDWEDKLEYGLVDYEPDDRRRQIEKLYV